MLSSKDPIVQFTLECSCECISGLAEQEIQSNTPACCVLGRYLKTASSSEAAVPGFTIGKNFKTNEYEAKLEFIKRRVRDVAGNGCVDG